MSSEEISYEDLEKYRIRTDTIAVCRKIRNLAKLDRIVLDDSEHRSGLNKHLFKYIEYCGYDILDYIKQYLSNLQPYMIERNKSQEATEHFICVIDNLYRVSVYIKINTKQFEEVVVSFHENNIRGIAKTNDIIKNDIERYVVVFADCLLGKVSDENKYIVKVFIQRGMKVLPLELPAVKCKDVFVVQKNVINQAFVGYCNEYIRDLYTSNLNLDFDSIEVFSILQQISFTSYGKDTFSSISLLIDSLCVQTDFNSKSLADMALVVYVSNLKLTDEQSKELLDLLKEKFKVTSIKEIDLILERVEANLALNYRNERNLSESIDDDVDKRKKLTKSK